MAIESDTDLAGLMLDSGETLTFGSDYTVLIAETDGETMDNGPAVVDGWLEALMRDTDVSTASIIEGVTVTYSGDSYRVARIDAISGGLSVLFLDPL